MRLDDYPVVCASKYKVRDVNVLKLFINTEDIKKRPTHFMNCTPERGNPPLRKKFIRKQLTTCFFSEDKKLPIQNIGSFFVILSIFLFGLFFEKAKNIRACPHKYKSSHNKLCQLLRFNIAGSSFFCRFIQTFSHHHLNSFF